MEIQAKVIWNRNPSEPFTDGKYQRNYQWIFDGGAVIEASASPEIVAIPYADPSLVDPEEAYIASLASCHMLFFLSIAAKHRIAIDSYEDEPIGRMGKNEAGKMAMLSIDLYPKITFPIAQTVQLEKISRIHHMAHAQCFLANSVHTKISIHTN